MAVQTTYNATISQARVGMIVNTEPNVLISRTVETAAGVGFGVPVQKGVNDNGCIVMAAGATEVLGVTVRERSTNPETPNQYAQYEGARLMRKGVLWVTVTDAGGVADGDEVWVLLADGTFSNADAGSSGSVRLGGGRWESTAANGELAKIRFDLDVPTVAGA
ncbi:hypothetical protein IWQ49_006380 [Labrenzia sp. EL_126]|nr:hypothetical protein [Labrenzia sp. EL_126]